VFEKVGSDHRLLLHNFIAALVAWALHSKLVGVRHKLKSAIEKCICVAHPLSGMAPMFAPATVHPASLLFFRHVELVRKLSKIAEDPEGGGRSFPAEGRDRNGGKEEGVDWFLAKC